MRRWSEASRVLIVASLLIACSGQVQSRLPPVTTTVSLTFDDGPADQSVVPQLLESHGMRGTFFIISGRVGRPGYLTSSQLQQLQAAGHEIGAHTVTHPDLSTLDPAQQQQEICESRRSLQALGLTIDNLAYPFGHYDADTLAAAEECGYASARSVAGLDCDGCAVVESIPLTSPFAIRTPDSIKADTTLEQMEAYVTNAEKAGGGWLVLVMHHICDACDPYSVSPSTLAKFLDWLEPRSANGTVVRTVAQMMGSGGALPPPPPPPATLLNGSLEADVNGDAVPDCWQHGGYGNNTFVWTRTSDAHTGSWAQKLELTSVVDGERKLVTNQRDLRCAPGASPGHTATVSAWYKSDQPVYLVAYYQDENGGWNWYAQSPQLPAQPGYTQAVWTTPALPDGAVRWSVGLSLRKVGTVVMDDFTFTQN